MSLSHAVVQVAVLQQRAADAGLPACVAIAVPAGGCRGVGPVDGAVPAIALTGKDTERHGDVKRRDPVGAVDPDGFVPRPRNGVVDPLHAPRIPQLVPEVRLVGTPVGLLAAGDIDRAVIPQRLRNVKLEAAFFIPRQVVIALHVRHIVIILAVGILIAFHGAPCHIVQGVKPFCGVTVAQQLEVGAKAVKGFRIEEAQGLSFMLAVVRELAAGVGDIERNRAPVAQVFSGPDGDRGIA